MKTIDSCQICSSKDLKEIFQGPYQPMVNDFKPIGSDEPATFYPTTLLYCENCGLGQLKEIIDPEISFPINYAYRTKSTKALVDNFKDLAREIEPFLSENSSEKVFDIGCNDGTFLDSIEKECIQIGIDPTDAGDECSPDIERHRGFFSLEWAQGHINPNTVKIITASNVFAHIPDIHDVVKGIKYLLSEKGIFVCENHDFEKLIEKNQYDVIYAEHLRFYTLKSLEYLFALHDMEIFTTQYTDIHGGSTRCFVKRKNSKIE